MKKINSMLLMIVCFFLFTNCKKEKPIVENNESKKTTKELLVDKNWYLTAATVSPVYYGIENLYDSLALCAKDNIIKYHLNGIKTIDNG